MDNSEDSARFLRLALPQMNKYSVPASPQNYAVWYQYVSGRNAALCTRLNEMIRGAEEFTPEVNQQLFDSFCADADEAALGELQAALRSVLVDVLNCTAEVGDSTSAYGRVLSNAVDQLGGDLTSRELNRMLSLVRDETTKVDRSTNRGRKALQKATLHLMDMQDGFDHDGVETDLDFLTGVATRRAYDHWVTEWLTEDRETAGKLCILLFAVDALDDLREQHGQLITDELLRFTANAASNSIRGRDLVARYDNDRFAVLLPDTEPEGAKVVADNICRSFPKQGLKRKSDGLALGLITLSVVVTAARRRDSLETLGTRLGSGLTRIQRAAPDTVSIVR